MADFRSRFVGELRHRKPATLALVGKPDPHFTQDRQDRADFVIANPADHIGDQRCDRGQTRIARRKARWADRHHLAPRIFPIGANMHPARPFELAKGIGHRAPRQVKGAGKLRWAAFALRMREVVQYRKMRQLHPLGKGLGHAVARQLINSQDFAEQRYRKAVGYIIHLDR